MLLELPPELILRVLCHLDLIDLLRASQVHSKLHRTIQSFPVLQYRIATQSACVEDNEHSDLPVSERLRILKNREEAWATCRIDFWRTIPLPHKPSDIDDLTGGIYFSIDESHHILHYLRLPSSISDEVKWEKIDVPKRLIAIGLSIYQHDLIALITLSPHPKKEDKNVLEIQLLKFSTGAPHPRADMSVLSVCELTDDDLAIYIEIVGPHLALNINFCSSISPNVQNYLCVFDWMTGERKMSIPLTLNRYSGLVFLSEEIMLLPDANASALDVWYIPSTKTPCGKTLIPAPRPLLSLSMPCLSPTHDIIDLICHAAPNPSVSFSELKTEKDSKPTSPQPPFFQTAGTALLMVTMQVINLLEDTITSWSMYPRRADVLAVCERVLAEEDRKVAGRESDVEKVLADRAHQGNAQCESLHNILY